MATPEVIYETDPPSPDGNYGWFITDPSIWLIPDYPSDVFWQWNPSGCWNLPSGGWFVSGGAVPPSGAYIGVAPTGENYLCYFASGTTSGSGPLYSSLFRFDSTSPEGSIIYPASGSYVGGIIEIRLSGSDTISGVEKFNITMDGNLLETVRYPIQEYWWDTTSETEGIKMIDVSVSDYAGNIDYDWIEVIVDNTRPNLTFQDFDSPVFFPTLDIYGEAWDDMGYVDLIEYWLTSGGEEVENWIPAVFTSGSGEAEARYWIHLSGISAGELYTLRIRAEDRAGNRHSLDDCQIKTFEVIYI